MLYIFPILIALVGGMYLGIELACYLIYRDMARRIKEAGGKLTLTE